MIPMKGALVWAEEMNATPWFIMRFVFFGVLYCHCHVFIPSKSFNSMTKKLYFGLTLLNTFHHMDLAKSRQDFMIDSLIHLLIDSFIF